MHGIPSRPALPLAYALPARPTPCRGHCSSRRACAVSLSCRRAVLPVSRDPRHLDRPRRQLAGPTTRCLPLSGSLSGPWPERSLCYQRPRWTTLRFPLPEAQRAAQATLTAGPIGPSSGQRHRDSPHRQTAGPCPPTYGHCVISDCGVPDSASVLSRGTLPFDCGEPDSASDFPKRSCTAHVILTAGPSGPSQVACVALT